MNDDKILNEEDKQKIKSLEGLTDEFDKALVISTIESEDKRVELLKELTNYYAIVEVINTLSEENKIKLLKEKVLTYESEKASVINTIESEDKRIELLKELTKDYAKASVINTIESEGKRIELLKELTDESAKAKVINTIESEDKRIELLKDLTDDYAKAKVINTIESEDKRIELLKDLTDDYAKASVIETIESEDKRVELLKDLTDESAKVRVINTIESEEKRIELLKDLTDDYAKASVIETLSEENKIKLLKELTDDYYKLKVINTLSEENKIKLLKENVLTGDYYKLEVINTLSEENKIKLLKEKVLTYESEKASVINTIESEEKRIELLKEELTDESAKAEVIKAIKSENRRFELLKEEKITDDSAKQIVINSLEEIEPLEKILLISQYNKISYKFDLISSYSLTDDSIKEILPKLTNEWDKLLILSYSTNQQLIDNNIIDNKISYDVLKNIIDFINDYKQKCNELKELNNSYKSLAARIHNIQNIYNNLSKIGYINDEFNLIKDYIEMHPDITVEDLNKIPNLIKKLKNSNSIELSNFCLDFCSLIINSDNQNEVVQQIENIFLKNNIPMFGKIFLCFQILYPNFEKEAKGFSPGFNFTETSRMSPELLHPIQTKDMQVVSRLAIGNNLQEKDIRFQIVFNDLLRIASHSNNRSLLEYLNNIEVGNKLFLGLQQGVIQFNNLDNNAKEILEVFSNHLEVLYEHTLKYDAESNDIFKNMTLEEKILYFSKKFLINNKYDLPDRIVRSFCYQAGIKNFQQLKDIVISSITEKDKLNRVKANELEDGQLFRFEQGDFVRCIGKIDSFESSLDNGNVCKEYLGTFIGTSDSDTTPLDIDFTLIEKNDLSIYEDINKSPTGFGFGNVYIILKKDNPYINITRDSNGNLIDTSYDSEKIEMFGTNTKGDKASNHWGARTGIASSDVDYILYKRGKEILDDNPYDQNGNVNYTCEETNDDIHELSLLKMEIVKNGFYIPVIDFSGKLIFTPEEFDRLKLKLEGLSYYDIKAKWKDDNPSIYHMKEHHSNKMLEDIKLSLPLSEATTKQQNNIVNMYLKNIIENIDYKSDKKMKYKSGIDGDLTPGSIEVISTGSTSRNTNIPGDYDFDYIFRIDAEIYNDPEKIVNIQSMILTSFGIKKEEQPRYILNYNIREVPVNIEGLGQVPIDITFVKKTNKVEYSTDMALQDRMNNISKNKEVADELKANIILAKKLLKKANCYKPNRKDVSQGGLGGVGIENWILQNGGSLESAAESFLEAVNEAKKVSRSEDEEYAEFLRRYQVYDFGRNHLSESKNDYPYDEFIYNNMNKTGYKKMCIALENYLEYVKNTIKEQTNQEEYLPKVHR